MTIRAAPAFVRVLLPDKLMATCGCENSKDNWWNIFSGTGTIRMIYSQHAPLTTADFDKRVTVCPGGKILNGGIAMSIGKRIQQLRIDNGLTQEQLAERLAVSRQSISKWEMDQSLPEIDKVVQMSKVLSVGTDKILLEEADVKRIRPQQLHLGSVYLIARDFEASVAFYEKLLSMGVSNRNCGNRFAEFFFDNKCLAIMNEENLPGHHYGEGDHKFVLNFWVEDLRREYRRVKELGIGRMTGIEKVHEGYYYFNIYDPDRNVCEITGGYEEHKISDGGVSY